MFAHRDPTATGFLERAQALADYRARLQGSYRLFARTPGSGFAIPEAFEEVSNKSLIQTTIVSWLAFPKSIPRTAQEIDDNRFSDQDEYIEWRTERDASNRVTRVTFTTEFTEYYEELAATT